jgi:hypothetical protein
VDIFLGSFVSSELMYTPAHCVCHLSTLEHTWHARGGCVNIVSLVRILVYVLVMDTPVHPALVDPHLPTLGCLGRIKGCTVKSAFSLFCYFFCHASALLSSISYIFFSVHLFLMLPPVDVMVDIVFCVVIMHLSFG